MSAALRGGTRRARAPLRKSGALLGALALLVAVSAQAETYRTLRGTFVAEGGVARPLRGFFEASPVESDLLAATSPLVLLIDDFALAAPGLALTPRQPLVFEGLSPRLVVEIADQIHLAGSEVEFLHLRAGGEIVAVGPDQIRFRYRELRGAATDGGRGVGRLGEEQPRRLHLAGTLYEVEQSFDRPSGTCQPFPPIIPIIPPPIDGGGIVVSGGNVILAWDEFDLSPEETVHFERPAGGTLEIARVQGGNVILEGDLRDSGALIVLAPAPLILGPATSTLAPTLESLGITAPDGATIVFENGELTVTTEGDLLIKGDLTSPLDVTRLTLVAGGDIVINGALDLPPDTVLSLYAGNAIELGEGPLEAPAICLGLLPRSVRAERRLGTLSLIATAAEPIDLEVRPGRDASRVHPGTGQQLPVAILGSADLDTRDIDPRSLRLGPGAAEPVARPRRRRSHGDLNGDHHPDRLELFSVREAGIAFGDSFVCLLARRARGGLLEGCDEIDTLPRGRGSSRAAHPR